MNGKKMIWMKYAVVQKKVNGKWVNCSCKFYITKFRGALNCLNNIKEEGIKYRIARGKGYIGT